VTAPFGCPNRPSRSTSGLSGPAWSRGTARHDHSHLEAEPLREATEWLARYQAFWDESHERLDALLATLVRRPER
jgi:hypothetical protein